MFGYITIVKDDLKIKEYQLFRAYYCGLCKQLGESFNHIVRLGLSYDMVFLALLLDSFRPANALSRAPHRCAVHPLSKRAIVVDNACVEYAAFMSILMIVAKIHDDEVDDGKNVKNAFSKLLYSSSFKKAYRKYKVEYDQIVVLLSELAELEKNKCAVIDQVADKFGEIMRLIFSASFVEKENLADIRDIAYQIGRWVYILDAYDDLFNDFKKNRYNPILLQDTYDLSKQSIEEFSISIRGKISDNLEHTLAQIAILSEKLNLKANENLLFNIFYYGMPKKQCQILERKKTKNEQSLSDFRSE